LLKQSSWEKLHLLQNNHELCEVTKLSLLYTSGDAQIFSKYV